MVFTEVETVLTGEQSFDALFRHTNTLRVVDRFVRRPKKRFTTLRGGLFGPGEGCGNQGANIWIYIFKNNAAKHNLGT